MTVKKLIVALTLLASASSAALAKSATYYDYAGTQAGSNSTPFEDAQHGGGIETRR